MRQLLPEPELQRLAAEAAEAAVVNYVNNKGKENDRRNPYIAELDTLYDQALTYERELGLTAAALKKINETALHAREESPLAGVFKVLAAG